MFDNKYLDKTTDYVLPVNDDKYWKEIEDRLNKQSNL